MTKRIEFPAAGRTYNMGDKFGVYEYGVYPRSSVLAGQSRRSFLDAFDSVEAALAAYPDAEGGAEAKAAAFDLSRAER